MITVADLLQTSRMPGNFFAPDAYVQGDIELGLNRKPSRGPLVSLAGNSITSH